jgi:hypothetical protein
MVDRVEESGSRGAWCTGLLQAIDLWICGWDLIKTKGYKPSNLDRAHANGRPG